MVRPTWGVSVPRDEPRLPTASGQASWGAGVNSQMGEGFAPKTTFAKPRVFVRWTSAPPSDAKT